MKRKRESEGRGAVARMGVFALLLVVFILSSLFFLAQNSQTATEKYETLIAVDEAGGDVEAALNDLRSYIYAHMNTQIGSDTGIRPPIQLKGTYERLVAQQTRESNEDLYAEAQADCERRNPTGFSGSNRLACIEAYVERNAVDTEVKEINEALYKFDFAPPTWSPDAAGWSIVLAILFAVALAIQFLLYVRHRSIVNH